MTQLDFLLIGADKVSRSLEPEAYLPHAQKAIGELTSIARDKAKSGFDSGSPVRQSLKGEVRPLKGRVYSLMNEKRSESIEIGRKRGGPLLHPDALKNWMRRLGIGESPFTIARGIQQRGVKGRFFMKAARQSAEVALPIQVRAAAAAIKAGFPRHK